MTGQSCDDSLDETGDPVDPKVVTEAILTGLAEVTDPIQAEVLGSMLLGAIGLLGTDLEDAAAAELLQAIEVVGDHRAAGMLAVLGTIGGERVGGAAAAGLNRLRARDVATPEWTMALSAPVTARDCVEVGEGGEALVLAARFDRAGAAHGVMILLDPDECGEAAEIMLLDSADLTEALAELCHNARRDGVRLTTTTLDPAEFRWRVEVAMDIRDDHDRDDDPSDPDDIEGFDDVMEAADLFDEDDFEEEDGPGYHVLAPLLRARLRALPLSAKPKPPHVVPGEIDRTTLLAALDRVAALPGGRAAATPAKSTPKLPAKRKTRDGQAPVLQLRVDLRGAKPPIWRRLQVPGDIPLCELHELLQIAFDWDSAHMYVFDTAYGQFGVANPELGFRSDTKVTLEQVASAPGAKLTYTYDFGDSWEHAIAVEDSSPCEEGATYPRCVGGRRMAPPEDCGGIWGYSELLEILDDPDHEEHAERLDWLGVDRPDQFDPAHFGVNEINDALAGLRRNTRRRK
ncbi:plasmid pRiA4b ORF-3 family protein [Nocardia sp. NPDC051570]|uniref:plasmid pRiA4b ORF-3 family protein n=1 Tax=Nocardia sp. NPDC051570 TaxID=3364324 RepID=UPI00378ED230